jgi:hypothetical protein
MKTVKPIMAALLAVIVVSCENTKFTEYRGPSIVQGKGGTVRVVKGVEFWENGEPDKKFKILGVIDDSSGNGPFSRSGDSDSAIAKAAREHGGDAVILEGRTREVSGVGKNGRVHYRQATRVYVVKYVE